MKIFKQNKLFVFTILAATIWMLAGCGGNSSAGDSNSNESEGAEDQETYELSLGHVQSHSHPLHTRAVELAEAVEEESEGRLIIEVFGDGVLGGDLDMLEQLQSGDLDMGLIAGNSHSPIVPEMGIENLPFVFESHEAAYEKMDGELGDRLIDKLKEKNILGLAWWEDGLFQITNNVKPINTPEDMEGMKIRVPENELRQDVFNALGANPIPMSFTELFSALQQNVVDGQTNALSTVYNSKFHEVQDYLTMINVTWSSTLLEINMDTWDSLPEDLQEILKENAIKYRDLQREDIQQEDEELLEELEKEGMEINYIDDLEPFREKSQSVYDKYRDVFGDELVDLILE